jgi:histidine phosphotransferase ChpT
MPNPEAAPDLRLAQVLTARIAHDLGSPLGTLAGMLDMLLGGPGGEDAELLAVAQQAAGDLRARLALQRAAWGGGGEPADRDGLLALLSGSAAAQRVRFDLAGPLFAGPVAAELVPLVLNGALLAAEALPRGGVVTGSGSPRELIFLPEGRNAAWSAETLAVLTGRSADPLAAGPRHVVAPLLLGLAAAQGFDCSLMPGMGAGLPALMLARR